MSGRTRAAGSWLTAGLAVSALAVLTLPAPAPAINIPLTLTVNSKADTADPATNGTCDVDLATAGDQCTLRAAIQEANFHANGTFPDRIEFAIPGSSGAKIIAPQTDLPGLTNAVVIDGYTQPGAVPNTKAKGTNAVLKILLDGTNAGSADGLVIAASTGNEIRGLVIRDFEQNGISITTTDGSDDNAIEGNFIGTDPTGTLAGPNGEDGVHIAGPHDGNRVGGPDLADRNLLSGNGSDGVVAGTDGPDTIQGNLIGTDATGKQELGNGDQGVEVNGPQSVVRDNIIAFNGADGVAVTGNSTSVGHDIGPNSIFFNDGLGIDLGNDGPTTNDVGAADDADTGQNTLLNWPRITAANRSSSTGSTSIQINVDSAPNTIFKARVYSNPRDTGEGKKFLGEITLPQTSAAGTASVIFVSSKPRLGESITATVTDPVGNTSEFTGEPRHVRAIP